MASNPRVFEMLEEMLDSGKSPEEVCCDCPELLPELWQRWQEFRRIDAEVEAWYPEPGTLADVGSRTAVPPASGLPQIPGFEVESVLGRGGMGIVYRARQLRLNRIVALKMLLQGGYASRHERVRFQREAESVASLQHNNIVQIYDIGDHEGRPFFTMEFVDGGTLAEKLRGMAQGASEAATLALTLADAVQIAHQAGIVHRDLKPANILLTADGTPKIADFGLARRLEDGASLTQTGVPVGTPSYMAPEQARGNTRLIGQAVDVYAIGAILYELLTGKPPFRADTQAQTVMQVISQDPMSPCRLNAKIPRDLETICLKCLNKEPARRYASAAALADDLRRFLEGRPILARPIGLVPRLGRWCKRNPAAVTIVAFLVAGTTISTWQAVRATRAEQAAQKRLSQVEKAIDLLPSVFRQLDVRDMARPNESLKAMLIERLEQSVKKLESELTGDPLVIANLREKFGLSLVGLGATNKAIPLLENSRATQEAMLGAEDPQTVVTTTHLATAYLVAKKADLAVPLLERALPLLQAKFGPDDSKTLDCRNNLCVSYEAVGRFDLALPLQEETLKLMQTKVGPDDPDTLVIMNNLAMTYFTLGQIDRALSLFEKSLELRKTVLGPDDKQTLGTMNALAETYATVGQSHRAIPLLEETIKRRKTTLGSDHPDSRDSEKTLEFIHNLNSARGRYEATLGKLGPDHIDTLLAYRDLAQMHLSKNQLDHGEQILVEIIEKMKSRSSDDLIRRYTIGLLQRCMSKREQIMPDSWRTFQSRSLYGGAILGIGKYVNAEPWLLTGYEGMKKRESTIPAEEKARLAEVAERLVNLYKLMDKKDEATKWHKELVTLRSNKSQPVIEK